MQRDEARFVGKVPAEKLVVLVVAVDEDEDAPRGVELWCRAVEEGTSRCRVGPVAEVAKLDDDLDAFCNGDVDQGADRRERRMRVASDQEPSRVGVEQAVGDASERRRPFPGRCRRGMHAGTARASTGTSTSRKAVW